MPWGHMIGTRTEARCLTPDSQHLGGSLKVSIEQSDLSVYDASRVTLINLGAESQYEEIDTDTK